MSFLSDLKKKLEGGVAQVNPFDNGATYHTVANRPVPTPKPAAVAAVAPTRLPSASPPKLAQPNRSIFGSIGHAITHNPATNFVGSDIVKPAINLPQTINNDIVKPITRDAIQPVVNIGSKTFDQANPLDNGLTFKQRTPVTANSLTHQLTHNGLTNASGSFLNNVTGIPTAIDAGRLGVAEITHNQPAIDNATISLSKNLSRVLPISLSENFKNGFGQDIATAATAPAAESTAQKAADYTRKIFNDKTGDPVHDPSVDAYATAVQNYLLNEQLATGGIDQNTPTSQVVKKVGGDAASTAANIVLSSKLPSIFKASQAAKVAKATGTTSKIAAPSLTKQALTFGGINAAAGVAGTATDPNASLLDYIRSGTAGFATGAALPVAGVVLPRAVRGVSNVVQNPDTIAAVLRAIRALPDTARTTTLNAASKDSKVQSLPTSRLTSYEGAPSRTRVDHYKAQIQAGNPVKPLIAVRDSTGKLGIEDGKHRLQAYKELGIQNVPVKVTTVENIRKINQGGYARIPGRSGASDLPDSNVPKSKAISDSGVSGNQTSKIVSSSKASIPAPELPMASGRTNTPRTPQSQRISPQSLSAQLGKREMPGLPRADVSLSNNTTLRQRGLTTSAKNSSEISPELKKSLSSGYVPSNLAEKALIADKAVRTNLKKTTEGVINTLNKPTRQLSDQDAAMAIGAMKANDAKGNLEAAQQIHDLLAEHGTQHGQFINAFKLLSNRTPDGMLFGARRALTKAGVKLDAAGDKELKTHIANIKKTQPGTPERDMAIHNMIKFVQNHIPSSTGDKIVNFWRAGLLTSPITTGGNILGNTGEALIRNAWVNPVATIADKVQSLVTGNRTKTLAGGQTKGAGQGAKSSLTYLKTGFDKDNPLAKIEAKSEINYGTSKAGKLTSKYVNGVYRALGAQDKPFRQAAARQASIDLARADAKNLKLKGQDAKDYVNKAVANPDWKPQTFTTANDSNAAGAFAVFANETALGKSAQLLKQPFTVNGRTYNGAIRQFILPFTQVPASIAMRIIHRSDLGASEIVNQLLRVRKGLPYDQRAVSEAIGNGSFGPAAIAAGYGLSKSGQITGNYPTDPKERALWKSEGRQANSVKVGNRWYSLNYLQPFGTLLGIGDQIRQDEKNGKSAVDIVSDASARAAKSVESQSFLQGVDGLLSAVNNPEQSAKQYENSTASSLVPNVVRTTARAFDPKQRDTKNILDAFKGTIPGVRESLPATQDMFGSDLKATDNPGNQLFNPLRPTLAKTNDPVVNELQRLQDTKNGIIPTQFDKSAITGATLTDAQVRQLNTAVNSKVKDAWSGIMKDPRYKALSDEDKATALKQAKDKIGDAYKRQFASDNNLTSALTKPASANSIAILGGQSPDYLAQSAASGGTPVNTKITPTSQKLLNEYNTLDAATKKKNVYSQPDYEYKIAQAKYDNDKANGSLSTAADIKARSSLQKEQVGSKYSKDTRDLYGLSKAELSDYLTSAPDGDAQYNQLKAYDQALLNAGLITTSKFKYGLGSGKSGSSSKLKAADFNTVTPSISGLAKLLEGTAASPTTGKKVSVPTIVHALRSSRPSTSGFADIAKNTALLKRLLNS